MRCFVPDIKNSIVYKMNTVSIRESSVSCVFWGFVQERTFFWTKSEKTLILNNIITALCTNSWIILKSTDYHITWLSKLNFYIYVHLHVKFCNWISILEILSPQNLFKMWHNLQYFKKYLEEASEILAIHLPIGVPHL